MPLRMVQQQRDAVVGMNENREQVEGGRQTTANSPSLRKGGAAALRHGKTLEVAPSSYYKVSLSTEKAKRR